MITPQGNSGCLAEVRGVRKAIAALRDMASDYVDLSTVDSGDRLAAVAADFANAAYQLAQQLVLAELPEGEQPLYLYGRERLCVALGAIRRYAMGADKNIAPLKEAYFEACYGIGVVTSYMTKHKTYDFGALSSAQHEFGQAVAKLVYG